MKFYTIEEFAKLKDIGESTAREWCLKGKQKNLVVSQSLPKLIIDENGSKETFVISLMNLKGGCGKTTIATHLAILLAKLEFKVLIIDCDHQNQCRFFFPDQEYDYSIKNVLSEDCDTEEAIYKPETDYDIDIIYSDYSLALFAADLRDEEMMLKIIEPVKQNYDFIIFDTSPNFDIINRNVARASTHIAIPIIPTKLHIEGLGHNIIGLEQIAKIPMERIIGVIPNIVKEKAAQHRAYLELLRDEYETVYNVHIPEDINLPKVNDFRINIFEYREKSKSSQALKKFTWETLRRL